MTSTQMNLIQPSEYPADLCGPATAVRGDENALHFTDVVGPTEWDGKSTYELPSVAFPGCEMVPAGTRAFFTGRILASGSEANRVAIATWMRIDPVKRQLSLRLSPAALVDALSHEAHAICGEFPEWEVWVEPPCSILFYVEHPEKLEATLRRSVEALPEAYPLDPNHPGYGFCLGPAGGPSGPSWIHVRNQVEIAGARMDTGEDGKKTRRRSVEAYAYWTTCKNRENWPAWREGGAHRDFPVLDGGEE